MSMSFNLKHVKQRAFQSFYTLPCSIEKNGGDEGVEEVLPTRLKPSVVDLGFVLCFGYQYLCFSPDPSSLLGLSNTEFNFSKDFEGNSTTQGRRQIYIYM